jgi:hypothetical protein
VFLPDGRSVAVTDNRGPTLIASLTANAFVARSPDPSIEPDRLAISPDGKRAFVIGNRIWVQVLDLSPLP